MWVIERTKKYVCGVFKQETPARELRSILGAGYRLRKLPARSFPIFVVETFEGLDKHFRYYNAAPKINGSQHCIVYEVSANWQPTIRGCDEMGALKHSHWGEPD
jgi:hypothetical protein